MQIFDARAVGDKLYFLRKKMGLTQAELAEAAGLSDRAYADIERGSVNMRADTLLRICAALRVTPNEVFSIDSDLAAPRQELLLQRLEACAPAEKETAFRLLEVYLQSLTSG